MKEVLIKHTSLTAKEVSYLSLLIVTCCGIVAHSLRGDVEPVLVSVAFSGIAFAFTYSLIRWLGKAFMKAGLKGRDMSKLRKEEMYVQGLPPSPQPPTLAQMGHWKSNAKRRFGDTKSPETMGAVCAVVYILTVIVFIPFPFYKDIVAATSGGGNRDVMLERQELETGRTLHLFPHSKVSSGLTGPPFPHVKKAYANSNLVR